MHPVTQTSHSSNTEDPSMHTVVSSQQPEPIKKESETTCQSQESMQELLDRLSKEKVEMEERFRKELQEKNIELTMQKVTIQHLQDAYVALKRGQPIPVPQNVTGNKIIVNGNGTANGHHNPVLDV